MRVLLVLLLMATPAWTAESIRTLNGHTLTVAQIDAQVQALMREENVPGLGLALIRDGRVVFQNAYGLRNVEQKLPLEPDTIMYGASLTKAAFATFVMQLVGEGGLDLDRPIAAILPKPLPDYSTYADLKNDQRWKKLTLRMLLDHTSGFANFRGFDGGMLIFHRDPGARYAYSGEGLRLAQFVIEQALKLDVGAEMNRRIFAALGMTRTSLTWREDFGANLSDGYGEDGSRIPHDRREHVSAAGSMDTTLADFSKFVAAVARGDMLKPAQRAEMVRRQVMIDSPQQFPTMLDERTDRWAPIRLGYGLGWGVFETPYGHAFFKEGHDDGTANYALCLNKQRDCILILSNSVRAERIITTLVNRLMGPVNLPAAWEGYAPAKP
jgi:CubicO group peptidase (beta-lactamase class C family)